LEKSLSYLRAYSRELKNSTTFKTEVADLRMATEGLGNVVLDAQRFLSSTAEGEREFNAINIALNSGVEQFDRYMEERYCATSAALESASQRLAELLAKHVESEGI
jgi:hypothetical protein